MQTGPGRCKGSRLVVCKNNRGGQNTSVRNVYNHGRPGVRGQNGNEKMQPSFPFIACSYGACRIDEYSSRISAGDVALRRGKVQKRASALHHLVVVAEYVKKWPDPFRSSCQTARSNFFLCDWGVGLCQYGQSNRLLQPRPSTLVFICQLPASGQIRPSLPRQGNQPVQMLCRTDFAAAGASGAQLSPPEFCHNPLRTK